jgi:transaldolase/glucose-6-phosphate isomerase
MSARMQVDLAAADGAILDALVEHARRDDWSGRLASRDTSLWSNDPGVRATMADRLGWLDAPEHFTGEIPALEGFGEGIRVAGFSTAVVMGMGGSSLAPGVLDQVFGTADGYLALRILDSTDPAAVARIVDDLDPLQTLWIVASKSGTTTEPLVFQADAWARVEAGLATAGSDQNPGELFAAITDPDRSLAAIPHHDDLRERFLNPPDIGGRYSALTYVGLVPASLMGLDLDALLAAASAMLGACREPDPRSNPGLFLGLALGSLARGGRDKLTLIADPPIASFGSWLEQLLAESTGKDGTGIVPVDREPLATAASYGSDRVFVALSLAPGQAGMTGQGSAGALLDDLERLGQPVIRIEIDDPIDLAGEMVRWEVATAFAGAVLGIDPFDQPNVEEAKDRTRKLLADGGPSTPAGTASTDGTDGATLRPGATSETTLVDGLRDALRHLRPPAYIAVQAFIAPTPERDEAISRIRAALAKTGCATTAGYGPRFLHSTGQLHKGGPPTGVFLQLTNDHPADRPIPGWPYTFGQLIDAQARGDREALRAHDRPVVHVHLGPDADADLAALERAISTALG